MGMEDNTNRFACCLAAGREIKKENIQKKAWKGGGFGCVFLESISRKMTLEQGSTLSLFLSLQNTTKQQRNGHLDFLPRRRRDKIS